QSYNPNASGCWIGGFSFGAWIGMQLMMRRPEISGFISLAPPASVNDFTFLAPCPSSGLIIHGEKDEVVPVSSVGKLAEKLSSQKTIEIDYHVIAGADHLFQDKIDAVSTLINEYLDKALDKAA
ncbi:MAG: prolyl oligopeptidase family serine peptidase, partial [Rhodospirillales bacterium]|nr:prolyl oligopeptidase family serine peptidase [Rhodospirillales bacterium]